MTFEEKFSELKAKYSDIDTSKIKKSFAVQVTMTDEDCGGTFYVADIAGAYAFEPYDYHDNTAAVDISSSLLEGILDGNIDAKKAFFDGDFKISGDVDDVLYIVDIIKNDKKNAVRKTARKTVKKEPKTVKTVKKEAKEADVKKAAEKSEKAAIKTDEPAKPAKKTAKKKSAKSDK